MAPRLTATRAHLPVAAGMQARATKLLAGAGLSTHQHRRHAPGDLADTLLDGPHGRRSPTSRLSALPASVPRSAAVPARCPPAPAAAAADALDGRRH